MPGLILGGKEESWKKPGDIMRWELIVRGEGDFRDSGAHDGSHQKRERGLWDTLSQSSERCVLRGPCSPAPTGSLHSAPHKSSRTPFIPASPALPKTIRNGSFPPVRLGRSYPLLRLRVKFGLEGSPHPTTHLVSHEVLWVRSPHHFSEVTSAVQKRRHTSCPSASKPST